MLLSAEPFESGAIGAGHVLGLIRDGHATTRTELARQTKLSRSTLADRVQALLAFELIREVSGQASTGGRPPAALAFNGSAGVVLVADLGVGRSRVAVTDLAGELVAELVFDGGVAEAPEALLSTVRGHFEALLADTGLAGARLWGIGIGMPAPVAHGRGEPVAPPLMPGWDGFSIPGWFAAHYDAPVIVDNAVNMMALGEHWSHWRDVEHLVFVRLGTTLSCGIVAGRRVHRGAQGTAGDIGHIRLAGHDDVVCRCGNTGCLEAHAGSRALAARCSAAGAAARTSRDVVDLVRAGHPVALQAVRDAGRYLGEVLAQCINFFNPGAIVLGGPLAELHTHLLVGIREVAIGRSLPMATRDLRTGRSELGERAGVIGAAIMVIDHVLAPDKVDRAVQRQPR